jgi:2-polyprenyl-3-methyl-5-hydroxy-6-metoxy-1,4-benzoquinol methylase
MICRICGNKEENQEYRVQEMMIGLRDVFDYFQCAKCRCLQIAEYPVDISRYYPSNYYSYQPISNNNMLKNLMIRLRDNYAVFGKGIIGKYLYNRYPSSPNTKALRYFSAIGKDAKILDVGCGAGIFLCSLKQLGFKNIQGIDPFIEKDIEYPNGVKIFKKELSQVNGKWDLILFKHSFEHIADPGRTLSGVSSILKPGGYTLIDTPTVSSFAWKHYGTRWVQLDAPRHFFIHSLESIRLLAEKANLELIDIVYDSSSLQFWGSEQYLNNIALLDKKSYGVNPRGSMFSKKEIANFASQAITLDRNQQGDTVVFIIRKRP